ncbi:urease accessory protein UreF [Rothia terrae]|uniref:urease accessory protein UreF n=1 Tax=Rothia terrae TaxID=396015 RepID=UPI002881910B|nr:urease accessory protein UreF [Rothia terrae]MDT0189295.1 urease accessory protein UreF [Rothia terrae]
MVNTSLASMLGMMQLTDSALPTGAFSHSLGFETYMHREELEDEASFSAWMRMFVEQQLTYTDALAIRMVYAAHSFDDVADLDELVTAQALPQQIRDGGITMGKRLLSLASASYPSEWADAYAAGVADGSLYSHQAVVWGVIARDLEVPVDEAVTSHLYATVISLTQNAVRAIPLGQNTGQRVIRAAQEWIARAVEESVALDEEDLGAIAPGLEIAQMQHERQRARLFMS